MIPAGVCKDALDCVRILVVGREIPGLPQGKN